jgi:long-chain fatty acid transport protein
MTFKQNALRAAAVLALGAALIPAHATNGYFSHGYGVKSKGMAGAGVALAQDAFSGANNPAQSAFAGDRYDVGVDLFMPEREMSRSFGPMTLHEAKSEKERFWIPEFGINQSINSNLSMGLTIYGNGGMNTTYPSQPALCVFGSSQATPGSNAMCGQGRLGVNLEQLIVAPTVAYQLDAQHAVGLSPLLVYQTFKAYGLQAFSPMTPSQSPQYLSDQGKDSSSGVGVRLGYLGQLNDMVSLGASYSPKINMSKFSAYKELFAEGGDFDIPANYTLGLAVKASPSVTVALDYQNIQYSGVRSIGNSSANTPMGLGMLGSAQGSGFGWQDVGVVKLGVQWQASDALTVRAGYSQGDNPIRAQDVSFNILAPGVIEKHVTLGVTMKLDAKSEVSGSYMHALSNSVTGNSFFGNGIQETITMKQNSLGVQYSRQF